MAESSIEWTDKVWNPVRGCSRVSPGCQHCYAERQAARFSGPGQPYEGLVKMVGGEPRWTGVLRPVPEKLSEPLRWRKPCRIFVNSMSDLFHEDVPDEFIDRVFAVMALATQHTFQVLTKRAGRMAVYLNQPLKIEDIYAQWYGFSGGTLEAEAWPLPNVWLGVSVEDQARADERIPHLLATPAAVRFLSCEPLLGEVDLSGHLNSLRGYFANVKELECCGKTYPRRGDMHWVICGGESGPGARPCNPSWIKDLVNQCRAASVPCFVKQLGSNVLDFAGRIRDRKGGEPSEWPEDLRVRQFPEVTP